MTTTRTILLVEDEPLIAMMLEDVLDTLGHRVAATTDSVSGALRHVEQGGFDLAILDLNLSGGEASWPVADALAERDIPFLLATGGAVNPPPERHRHRPALAKPFTMGEVEQALDALA